MGHKHGEEDHSNCMLSEPGIIGKAGTIFSIIKDLSQKTIQVRRGDDPAAAFYGISLSA